MIRATRLRDLPVVDLESAVKIGRVHELILDPGRRRVAAVVVRRGRSLFGTGGDWTVPAAAVVSVGVDALTIRSFRSYERSMELANYPTLASLFGRKVLSRRGKMLGAVADILLDERTGAIAGYALDVRTGGSGLFGLARRGGDRWPDYVKAEADLRVGRHIIVAPDHALVQGEKIEPLTPVDPSEDPTGWQPTAPAPPVAAAPLVANKRPRRSRPAEVAGARLGSTVPIAVNGNGQHAEVAIPAEGP
ncbi:MAG TPA: PRC-barrel domain-containing protein [Chloroflexota bacterium]